MPRDNKDPTAAILGPPPKEIVMPKFEFQKLEYGFGFVDGPDGEKPSRIEPALPEKNESNE